MLRYTIHIKKYLYDFKSIFINFRCQYKNIYLKLIYLHYKLFKNNTPFFLMVYCFNYYLKIGEFI